jgi:hypothetical protein
MSLPFLIISLYLFHRSFFSQFSYLFHVTAKHITVITETSFKTLMSPSYLIPLPSSFYCRIVALVSQQYYTFLLLHLSLCSSQNVFYFVLSMCCNLNMLFLSTY